MAQKELQISIHGKNIAETEPEINYEGVTISRKVLTDNPNYIFLYVNIDPNTKPGKMNIVFKKGKKKVASYKYELKARKENSANRTSFTSADAVYLLMPDRFVNGDPKNDNVKGYHQKVDRSNLGERHGGDLKGVIEKVPYIADLGCTALWITPFYDNNDTQFSYPHYSAGDYFKVDPRMGTNQDYKNLADSCHKYGLKLIIDVVPNHCGSSHWWCADLPAEDWFHKWPTYTGSNYRMTAWTDPHASEIDKKILKDVNLKIPKGKIIGLLGKNGTGKTTLIKLINDLLTPTSGEVYILGNKPGVASKKVVSYLPDNNFLNSWMTAEEIINLFKEFYADFRPELAYEMLLKLGVSKKTRLRNLSKGNKEKVCLILVMSRNANLYILDEPIAAVDPATRDYIVSTIINNYNPEASVIISTHLIADIEPVLDEAIFINNGKIVLHKTVDEIREEHGKSVDELFREVFRW